MYVKCKTAGTTSLPSHSVTPVVLRRCVMMETTYSETATNLCGILRGVHSFVFLSNILFVLLFAVDTQLFYGNVPWTGCDILYGLLLWTGCHMLCGGLLRKGCHMLYSGVPLAGCHMLYEKLP